MLKLLFEWFDGHPHSYWIIAALPTLLLLGWSAFLVFRDSKRGSSNRQEMLFALLLLAVLIAWRWPFLLSADEYNPDESQLIAGAITLRADPVPWRSVDGTTSGPLNFYFLLPIRLLGLPLDYFTARLTGLLLIWIALVACYRLLRSRFDPASARLGILPPLAFFSTVTDSDFIQYSSENLSIFLTALSACCVFRPRQQHSSSEWRDLAGCFIAGMLPWAKLQSAPLAAALALVALFSVASDPTRPRASKLRASVKRVLAAVMPTVLVLGIVTGSGQFEHFFRSYLLQNLTYIGAAASFPLPELWGRSLATGHFPFFLFLSLLGAVAGLVVALRTRRGMISFLVGGGLVAASAICILATKRPFLHYLLLSIVPLTIWSGNGLGCWWNVVAERSRRWIGLIVLTLGGLAPFGFRASQPGLEMFGNFSSHWSEPRNLLANTIRRYASPGARVAIWGWLPNLHVQTGLAQGTRDGNTYWAITPSPQREYFRQRFLSDLTKNQPAVFVDAVGNDSFLFENRLEAGHEIFPQLADYIRQHYQLVIDVEYARLYARNGLSPKPAPNESPSHPQSPTEHSHVIGSLHVESMSPPNLPQWRMRTGFVQMMQPPAEIVWSLDDSTREIVVEYGLAAEAYRHPRSDGAELIFDLLSKDVPIRHLFRRFLEPVQQPADRGAQLLRLILPPFKPGARLVARTTMGPSGDAGWDWIYLGRVSPVRSPGFLPAQFPHFNRVPDSANADLSYLLKEQEGDSLVLHAPASLTYNLNGKEQRLRFDYAFREGAYSNGGQTDGATFLVELQRADQPVQTLFSRKLAPASEPADRGAHSADVFLPAGNGNAKLFLRIDPGPSNGWDWTYVTNLTLE